MKLWLDSIKEHALSSRLRSSHPMLMLEPIYKLTMGPHGLHYWPPVLCNEAQIRTVVCVVLGNRLIDQVRELISQLLLVLQIIFVDR
jgi:hypothetical protein